MRPDPPRVTIVIPTLGLAERSELIESAVQSVLSQEDVRSVPLVVLNGTRASPAVERWLRADERIRLVTLRRADLPTALRVGRRSVDTAYFGSLDDDDELLPGALAHRIELLESEGRERDVVVTNGYRRRDGVDELNVAADAAVAEDPLRSLLEGNWLLPGSWLCRTATVGEELFEGMPRYLECTYLAARFATGYRMRWSGRPTVAYRLGSPGAESESRGYVVGQADALRRILELPLPADVERDFERRIATAYHDAAEYDRRSGDLGAAWRWHLASLASPGGWRYLPYTRHLLGPASGAAT
ncbi:MAG: glycosyltransferase family 2 protein [Gemmatimonadota bacterium]